MISTRANRQKIAWRATAPSIILVVNSFVWYIFTYWIFIGIVDGPLVPEAEKMLLYIAYFVSVAVSAIIGSKIFPHMRIPALSLWQFIGAIATLSLILISSSNMLGNTALALFLGASVGIGLPSCLSYFADSTAVENRGSIGGIIWSIVGLTVLIFAFLSTVPVQWAFTFIAILAIWRCLGCLGFIALSGKHETLTPQKSLGYLEILRKREILLYLFPWLMFCIINFAESSILNAVFVENFELISILEYGIIGVVATVAGYFSDIVGRKRIVIAGFIMLGLEYAALSVLYEAPWAVYVYLVLDGITWGLLFSVFFMAIWGDLGENYGKEKYYTLGGLPFLLAGFLPILIEILGERLKIDNLGGFATAAFSLASFFLFLAVLPLMYAPETLPEKTMKAREMKNYLEKAQKEAEKYG